MEDPDRPALEAHGAYLGSVEGHPPARVLVDGITRRQGQVLGVDNAVLFWVWDLG